VPAACHVAARSSYRVRAGEWGTIVVSVRAKGTPVAGATLRITLPGGKTITRVATSGGTVTFTVKPKKRGAISIRTGTCTGSARVKVFAPKVPTSHHPPSFTG
jgi:hypothetical protein